MEEKEYFPRPAEREKEKRKPYEVVARAMGLSAHRLRRLLNTGRVEGSRVRKKGRGFPWRWLTTVRAVEKYKSSVKTPREYGRLGGRPALSRDRRGRPRKRRMVSAT